MKVGKLPFVQLSHNTKLTPRAIFGASKLALKVKKNTGFLSKSGGFMVAEAGLEPTTSGL